MAIRPQLGAPAPGQGGHVVYVNIATGQLQTDQRRRRRALLLAGSVVGAMCACLAVSGFLEERQYGAYISSSLELTEHVVNEHDMSDMETRLASEEMRVTLVKKASKGLPSAAARMAASLADEARTTTLDDCSQKASLDLIKSNFETLMTKMEGENATLHTKDHNLETAAAGAKKSWMEAESTYRLAETKLNTATQASTFASSQYSKYSTAVTEGQKSLNALKPKYDQEKQQLQGELPVLMQLKALIASLMGTPAPAAAGAAVGGRGTTLTEISSLVSSLVPPSADRKVAGKVDALKQELAATATSEVSGKAHAVIDKLMAEMALRIAELEKMTGELQTELSDNKLELGKAEQSLVSLGEELDKAKNSLNTADLSRKTLGGEYAVAKQAYEDNHATFLDDSARLSREIKAIGTILDKVDLAIAKCTGKTTSATDATR